MCVMHDTSNSAIGDQLQGRLKYKISKFVWQFYSYLWCIKGISFPLSINSLTNLNISTILWKENRLFDQRIHKLKKIR